MPMQSQAQRKFLWARDPKLAREFEKKTPEDKLPERADNVILDPNDAYPKKMRIEGEVGKSLFKEGDVPDSEFDANELKMGIDVEKEHTDNPEVAKQIAKAHLKEMPDYYTKLKKMESADITSDVKEFFVENPNPDDDTLHKWAESKGYAVNDVEEVAYRLATRSLHTADYPGKMRIGGPAKQGNREEYADNSIQKWITAAGKHIPIMKGESESEITSRIQRSVDNKDEEEYEPRSSLGKAFDALIPKSLTVSMGREKKLSNSKKGNANYLKSEMSKILASSHSPKNQEKLDDLRSQYSRLVYN